MINLYYSEAYWGHSATMNGPHKVVDNLIKSLDQEKIDYAINEEIQTITSFENEEELVLSKNDVIKLEFEENKL